MLSQGLLSFSHLPNSKLAGGTQETEGTQPGQLTQNDQRDISYHIISYLKQRRKVAWGHCSGADWVSALGVLGNTDFLDSLLPEG